MGFNMMTNIYSTDSLSLLRSFDILMVSFQQVFRFTPHLPMVCRP